MMKLIGDFCAIKQAEGGETEFEYVLSLDKNHFIYRAHFPENPITPGVCIIQLCKELVERHKNVRLALTRLSNVKFLSVIDPRVHDTIRIKFVLTSPDKTAYKVSAVVYWETTIFSKLNFLLNVK